MTSTRMAELALKKRMLQQRSLVLRCALGAQVSVGLAPALSSLDKVMSAGRWLRRHPAWLVGGAVALLVWRPKGLVRWAGRGVWVWQTWIKLRPALARLSAPQPVADVAQANPRQSARPL